MQKFKSRSLIVVLTVTAGLAALPAAGADNALKELMKKMGATATAGDAKGLAPILEQAKSKAKPEYPNWAAIAEKGKAAAQRGDLDGAKAACKECHNTYRSDYKTKYGSKAP